MAMLRAEVGVARSDGSVAVFDPVCGFLDRAGAGVDADEVLRADEVAEGHILIGAHLVRFLPAARKVQRDRALVLRPDCILPVVTGNEVAAGPADGRDLQVLDLLDVVLPETVFVGQR
jgi:hypothetical protein